jgi:cation transporter-like permease
VDNEIVRRLIWSGLLAATGALASILAARVSSVIYRRIFDEDPPD